MFEPSPTESISIETSRGCLGCFQKQQEITRLLDRLAKLERALRQVEWYDDGEYDPACPACGASKRCDKEHDQGCIIGEALAACPKEEK